MTRNPRLPELFAVANELEGEARAAWLAELHRQDADLAREVEELLAAAPAGERLFDTPAWQRLPPGAGEEAPQAPEQVGPYRIRREIGHGGMGRVFLAEQEEEEFRRTVALKIIERRPFMAEETVRRFRGEVRILAGLDHPGIARFFDGGRAADGTWFLALEYVEGEDLLAFVRRRDLDLRARVELFLQVLDAVDFAHRRLVVHRDLKPGNVLVGADGRPKLLDFGISKIVDPDSADEATRTELRAFTPAYASPEQLRGERVTIAADVYSLGVMLYEILAGQRPFALRTASGFDPAARERDPAPPSTAARQTSSPSGDTRAATLVGWRDLAGDLDAITLKALRTEPESRYLSAAAFADDLRRWLRGEPVAARRGGRRYRLAKFVARHRTSVAFATLAALALAAGLAGTLVQSRRATRQAAIAREQRDFALRQLSRAEAINELNAFLLSDAAPNGRPFTPGELLAQAERIVERGETGENRVELLIAIGRQYEVRDEHAKARRLLAEAYEQVRRSPDSSTRAKAACALAGALSKAGELPRAESLLQEGLSQLPEEPQFVLHRVFCLLRGGAIARDSDEGEIAVERVQAARLLLRESRQGSALMDLRTAMELAESFREAGRLREAKSAFGQAWARLTAMGRGETERAGTLLNNWALVLRGLGQPLAAERLFRRAVRISSADGTEASVSPVLLNNLARTLIDLGRLVEARDYVQRADAQARRAGDEIVINQVLLSRVILERQLGNLDQAAGNLSELEARLKASYPPEHVAFASLASEQGLLAQARGDAAAAGLAQDRAIALAKANGHDDFLPELLLRRSGLALASHRPESARADAARALTLEQRAVEAGAFSCYIGRAHLTLGRALHALGKPAEARAAFAAARQHLEPALGTAHPESQEARRLSRQLSLEVAGNKS
jgi:eukaryotic-like serine/threonine-protein kinase